MKTFTLTETQMERILQCLAKAESDGVYEGCVNPNIGKKTIEMVQSILYQEVK